MSVCPSIRPATSGSICPSQYFFCLNRLHPDLWGRPTGLTLGNSGACCPSGGACICPQSGHYIVHYKMISLFFTSLLPINSNNTTTKEYWFFIQFKFMQYMDDIPIWSQILLSVDLNGNIWRLHWLKKWGQVELIGRNIHQ